MDSVILGGLVRLHAFKFAVLTCTAADVHMNTSIAVSVEIHKKNSTHTTCVLYVSRTLHVVKTLERSLTLLAELTPCTRTT